MTKTRFLLLAVLGLLLAGCGGDSRPSADEVREYQTRVVAISNQFATAGRTFRDSVGPGSTPQQAAAALEAFQAKVLRAAGDLDRLRPPPTVVGPHRQLAVTFRQIARATQPSIDAGKAGNAAALRAALTRLRAQLTGPLGRRAQAAALEIDRRLGRA